MQSNNTAEEYCKICSKTNSENTSKMSQEGKVAFITGGLGGIGFSFGENLLQHGAKVNFDYLVQGQ